MSLFPALQPSARSFVPGSVPVSVYNSISGKETRVITGATAVAHTLQLTFGNVSEATARLVMSHWYERQGVALAFTLPTPVWAGWLDYSIAVAPTQEWRYQAAPSVETVSPGIMSLSVQLVSVL